MNKLQTESFTVIMLPPITVNQPVDGRKYTVNWKKDEYPAILIIPYLMLINRMNN